MDNAKPAPKKDGLWVRARPTDWRSARYLLNDIDDLQLQDGNGAIWVLGSVLCSSLQEGEQLHACHDGKSHRIKIYIIKKDNEDLFPALLASLHG